MTEHSLIDEVTSDLCERWAHRRPVVMVEGYAARYPALQTDDEGFYDLIVTELDLRMNLATGPEDVDMLRLEYVQRFPRFKTDLLKAIEYRVQLAEVIRDVPFDEIDQNDKATAPDLSQRPPDGMEIPGYEIL